MSCLGEALDTVKEGKIRLENTKLSLGKVLKSIEFFAYFSLVNSREAKVSQFIWASGIELGLQ